MIDDRFGLPLSTTSQEAVAAYIEGVDLMTAACTGADARYDDSLALDPDFAPFRIAKARGLQMQMRIPEAKEAAARARELAAALPLREKRHVEIVALVIEGKGSEAFTMLNEHVADYPCDGVPISLALGVYGLFGFSGRADHHAAQRDFLDALAPHWQPDWWFDTFHGWSHVEAGDPAFGIPILDRALDANPRNAFAAHGRAHGYYELGEAREGIPFIEGWLPSYAPAAPLHGHIAWHLALFHLQTGDREGAMEIFDRQVRPSVCQAPPLFTLVDSSSFIWRLRLYGEPPDDTLAREVGDFGAEISPAASVGFFDMHASFAMAGIADRGGLQSRRAELDAANDAGTAPTGALIGEIVAGVAAFAAGDYAAAIEHFEREFDDLSRLGGSNAQRDVVTDSLIAAHRREGNEDQAQKVMKNRAGTRAKHLNEEWLGGLPAS